MKRPKKQTVQDAVFVLTGIAVLVITFPVFADEYPAFPYIAGAAFGGWVAWYGREFTYLLQTARRTATGTTATGKEDAK